VPVNTRRWPWLSGLIVALIGAVWMIGQVVGGLGAMAGQLLPAAGPAPFSSDPGYRTPR
jgi:hypothetical protein